MSQPKQYKVSPSMLVEIPKNILDEACDILDGIEAVAYLKKYKWHKVEEELPEESRDLIVRIGDDGGPFHNVVYEIAMHDGDEFVSLYDVPMDNEAITHWRYLDKPDEPQKA